jgi:hypothetical protein
MSRSIAAPLPQQVSLRSWFDLLEVAFTFNCLAWLLSPAALFIRSAHSQDFVQPAGITRRVTSPGASEQHEIYSQAALSIFAHENVIRNEALAIDRPE